MKYQKFNILHLIVFTLLPTLILNAEESNKFDNNKIYWTKIKQKEIKKGEWEINWEKSDIKNNESSQSEINWELISTEELLEINLGESFDKKQTSESKSYKSLTFGNYPNPIQISPTIQINNFLKSGSFSNNFNIKSAFSGGEAGGTGNQNYSYRIDYGLNELSYISSYIAEADDPYYYKINNIGNLPSKNYWRNYAINFNHKLSNKNLKNLSFSLNTSLEYWDLATIYKKNNNTLDYYSGQKVIGSISIPTTFELREDLNLTIAPRMTFIPKNIDSNSFEKNFYGNNFLLGLGMDSRISKDFYFLTSYSFVFGPGHNSFDENLVFSRNNIYSYGFKWDPSPRVGLTASITNAFGETPSTGHLTIPSGNLPLYSLKLRLDTDYLDPPQKSLSNRQRNLTYNGHTINSALLPNRGESQISIDIDNQGNYNGFYGYSFSNIFQVEIINIGSINNSDLSRDDKFSTIRNTYYKKGNLNNRFGGKLLILSPINGNPIWLSSRVTLGRDQKSDQGYLFSELINTYEISSKLAMNINPKLSWNGIKSFSGTGLGLNYQLNKKIQIIPEYNINFSDTKNNNSSFIIRYLTSKDKSIDLYISNAEGGQDMAQMLKAKELRAGFKINLIF